MLTTTSRLLAALILVARYRRPGRPTELRRRLGRLRPRPLSRRQRHRAARTAASPFPIRRKAPRDQSFRLIVRPDIWGKQARIRLSNAFGTKPVTFDAVHIGLQQSGSAIVPGTNRPVTFGAKPTSPSPPAPSAVSDPVTLPFVRDPNDKMLDRPPPCRLLPRQRRHRPDDLACQGADHLLHQPARQRRQNRR